MTDHSHIDLHSLDAVNKKLMEILKMPKTLLQMYTSKPYITEFEQDILEKAGKAYNTENFVTAYAYYAQCSKSYKEDDNIINITQISQLNIIIQYLSCKCLLKSEKFTDLLKVQNILLPMVESLGSKYPMIYYLLGELYLKIFCFHDAEYIVNKGLAILNDKNLNLLICYVPITNEIIYESTIQGLSIELLKLKKKCSRWNRPDAICFMQNCRENSPFHVAGRDIYFNSPAFNGMVTVICDNANPCHIQFHLVCWKVQKKLISPEKKVSNKDFLHWKCFTPDCFNHANISSNIKKIEILSDNKSVKIIESSSNKSDRIQNTSNLGTRRKMMKSHQSEKKISKCKRSSNKKSTINISKKPKNINYKIENLSEALSNLICLREIHNFHIKKDDDWRPDKKYYNNLEFRRKYDDISPAPECSNDNEKITGVNLFIYSYFYRFISKNAPVKIVFLEKKWHEAMNLIDISDSLLYDYKYANVIEFLLQSEKFVIIGDYICTPGSMPATYTLVKNNICTTLRYLMSDTTEVEDENLQKIMNANSINCDDNIIHNSLDESINVRKTTNTALNAESNDKHLDNITEDSIDIQNDAFPRSQTPIVHANNNEIPADSTTTNINGCATKKSLLEQLQTSNDNLERMHTRLTDMKMSALRTHLDSQYLIASSHIKTLMMNCQKDYIIIKTIQNILIQSGAHPLKLESQELTDSIQELEAINQKLLKNYNEILNEISCRERCKNIDNIFFSIPENQLKLPNYDIVELLREAFELYRQHLCSPLMSSPLHLNSYSSLVHSNRPIFVPIYVNYDGFPHSIPPTSPAPPVPLMSQYTCLQTNPVLPPINEPIQQTPVPNSNNTKNQSEVIKELPLNEPKETLKTIELQVEDKKVNSILTLNDKNKSNGTSHTEKLVKVNMFSIDILMNLLRSRNRGVLEYDLLWSVQKVRKQHNNSLTNMSLSVIMNEAEQWLVHREKLQLADYSMTVDSDAPQENTTQLSNQYETSLSSNSLSIPEEAVSKEPTIKKNPWNKIPDKFLSSNANYEQDECAICYEPLNKNPTKSNICELKCNHIYHKKCIERWFKEDQTCPTCRNWAVVDTEYPPL